MSQVLVSENVSVYQDKLCQKYYLGLITTNQDKVKSYPAQDYSLDQLSWLVSRPLVYLQRRARLRFLLLACKVPWRRSRHQNDGF